MGLPKILCLHGFGQNKTIMAKKTKFISDKFKNKAEFVYISGKFPLPEYHPIVEGFNSFIKKKGLEDQKNKFENFFSWFPTLDQWIPDYIPMFDHLCKVLREEGPFVGVLGFSQGACVATLLTKLLEINHPLVSPANHPPLKFSIMISGLIIQIPEILKIFEIPAITPNLHMLSKIDQRVLKVYSIENANCYINPIVIEHNLGHKIPSTSQYLSIILQFINSELKLRPELQAAL
ncbi:hypothetical protein CONCODRAFT_5648 [Conidiobolus coronatus NRRL 28638]|uniref:Serine hydrolase domain-containing protein n=1 Tax=Conidiobolus coronatus (strain ATCC 28846 / CBS 209.66 / NRRL 28638) TaxID=796925 RepID=A0A137P9I8_CONC2|nr:hypothetical protein CONCODRAFT_5648 [Conidiobolus coronatus NRRL 28638]|eukprot:KXN71663.1 hypothetical protein CONCODRAFT_5648 [Conidiobolus coronatus NRRL 28638]